VISKNTIRLFMRRFCVMFTYSVVYRDFPCQRMILTPALKSRADTFSF